MSRDFDGSTQGAAVGGMSNLPTISTKISFAGWFKYSGLGTGAQCAFTVRNGTASSGSPFSTGITLSWGSSVEIQKSGGGVLLSSGVAPSLGTWQHWGYSFDGTTHRVYLNGSLQATSTSIQETGACTSISVGRYDSSFDFFNGSVAEPAVWNDVLSAGDFSSLAGGSLARDVNPTTIVWYTPLRGVSSPEPDVSTSNGVNGGTANGNDLMLSGAPPASAKPPGVTYQSSPVTATAAGITFFLPQTTSLNFAGIAGGGGADAGGVSLGGEGGGGGEYSGGVVTTLTIDQAYTINVGSGGAVGVAGGNSWFKTTGTIIANGGSPGAASGGAGGTGGIGTTLFDGGAGGTATTTGGAGGGSSASAAGVGNPGVAGGVGIGGSGGTAPSGGGNGGAGGNATVAGVAGSAPGGGGGGGGTAAAGNVGAAGQVVLSWPVGAASLNLIWLYARQAARLLGIGAVNNLGY